MSDPGSEVSEPLDEVLSGDDALVAAADLLYQQMRAEHDFESYFEDVELQDLAVVLRGFLATTFEGPWPEIQVNPSLIADCFPDLKGALNDALKSPLPLDTKPLLGAMGVLGKEMKDDERLQRFFDHIRSHAAEEGEGEEEEAAEEDAAEEGDGQEDDGAAAQAEVAAAAKDAAGTDINVNSFANLHLEPSVTQAANDAWRLFISTAESREAAGEAIYAALFEGAPSLQSLFTTPRAVQSMRFMNGLASFVTALDDPPKLFILVETLGFGHLHLDVTVPRVIIFRDAILDLFMLELAEKFSSAARDGWKKLLNYVGGAIIYIKANYATRINTLLKSWKQVNKSDQDKADDALEDSQENLAALGMQGQDQDTGNNGWLGFLKSRNRKSANKGGGTEAHGAHGGTTEKEKSAANTLIGSQGVPTTYPDMFVFNAAVMGYGTSTWMSEVLACFPNIVTNVANSARLQEECDVLALRIARVAKGNLNLTEYKSCMLASLRSLLPKDWDSAHEVAWSWLWENVERLILRIHGQPPIWEKALAKILASFDEESKFQFRKDIYSRFFTLAPAGQDFFKQSNTYLHFIADKILGMTLDLFTNPVKMVDDISALGLRHVGYGIPTELFGPFVTACVEVLMTVTTDDTTIESFRYSLGLVSKMLVRTITEGSTIVMKAINANSQKMLRKAISCAPRGERAKWMLLVQVGTQSISPLAWAIESGNLEAAVAMIRDLLTFRADRDRYYYGVDDLFNRHPDLIKMLCDRAPDLLPKLLDGLIWRSRITEAGFRRVNYYVKHLLISEEGTFSPALAWITETRDPKIYAIQ
jgi:hemoglobin-like flavoprotein